MTKATGSLFVAYSFRGIGVSHHQGRQHGGRLAGMVLEQQPRTYVLMCRQEAERATWGWLLWL